MIAELLSTLAGLDAWSTRLLDTSWQAGLLAAAAWLLCRLFPRMPAQVRVAVWWLVCAKFLAGLAWTQPIALPILPAASVPPAAPAATAVHPSTGVPATVHVSREGGIDSSSPASATSTAMLARTSGPAMPLALSGMWLAVVLVQVALTYRAYRRTRSLVKESAPADESIAALARDLSARIGAGDVPVRLCPEIDTPQVTGAFTPIILLPPDAKNLSHADLEMTLCHELLHVRRGDLWIGWLPSLAQRMFFFHPLAWLAAREYALAREAACDAAVLRALGSAPDEYGALLLRLGIAHADIAPVAVGASSSFRTLKRRLTMLKYASVERRARAARWWIVAAAAALAIVPLRLVAQSTAKAAPADRESWVLLRAGDDVSMNGSSEDVNEARRQRNASDEALLWFRHNGKAFVVRDPATLSALHALFEPMSELGNQQGALGDEQGAFGEQQAKLGSQQGRLGEEMGTLAAKMNALTADQLELTAKQLRYGDSERAGLKAQQARLESEMKKISAQMAELGRRQEEFGRMQEELGREQEKFGRQQEALGHQQEEAAKRAEQQLREIMERAIATGLAQPAR
jgi:bla regulator protein BlaR1